MLMCVYIYTYIHISSEHENPCSGSTCQTTSTRTWDLNINIYNDICWYVCIYIHRYIIITYIPLCGTTGYETGFRLSFFSILFWEDWGGPKLGSTGIRLCWSRSPTSTSLYLIQHLISPTLDISSLRLQGVFQSPKQSLRHLRLEEDMAQMSDRWQLQE